MVMAMAYNKTLKFNHDPFLVFFLLNSERRTSAAKEVAEVDKIRFITLQVRIYNFHP